MFEFVLGFVMLLAIFALLFGLAACHMCNNMDREIKLIRHQICEELTTHIPHIIRQQSQQSFH